jgi:hypothetical protein
VLLNGLGFGNPCLALMSSIICLPFMISTALVLYALYVVGNGAQMTSSKMLGVSPLRKKPIVSSLLMVYPACRTRSLKSEMYWSTSGKHILHLSSLRRALCCSCESEKWSLNCCMNVSQTSYMLLLTGSRESIHVPMSWTHAATCGPWNSVRAIETLRIAEFSPGMPELAQK